jgi:hypothetical protein
LQQQQHNFDRASAWAFITPCHWDAQSNQVIMADPSSLDLTAAESQALVESMQPYFASDGIRLSYSQPHRWLASGDLFRGLPTASLDRVIGRSIQNWMPEAARAKPLRRLQNEMQMLLYTHPVNDARQARGVPAINSFWISGTGRESALLGAPLYANLQAQFNPDDQTQHVPAAPETHWHDAPVGLVSMPPALEALTVHIPQALRDAALRKDWAAWAQAWRFIDATYCSDLLRAARRAGPPTPSRPLPQLTLCGDNNAITFQAIQYSALRRLAVRVASRLRRKAPQITLERL